MKLFTVRKTIIGILGFALLSSFAGCSHVSGETAPTENKTETSSADTSSSTASNAPVNFTSDFDIQNSAFEKDSDGYVVLKGLADLVPHYELLQHVAPELEKQGVKLDIVSTAADSTWPEKVYDGEVAFHYYAHWPAVAESNETNGFDLVDAGDIHVEPIGAYSEKYNSVSEVPDDATFIIPNDATNEYRALRIIEQAGFIKLKDGIEDSLRASVNDIEEYTKPISITEIDSIQIIGRASEFDVYITNTNKALEAGIDVTKYLFREGEDSPYANIISTKPEYQNDPAIQALVAALRSEDTKQYILDSYNGAVIPAK